MKNEEGRALVVREEETGLWLQGILEALDDAVLVVSPKRELLNANAAALRMFGYTLEELKEGSTEVLHVDHAHYVIFGERIRAAFAKNRPARFEFQLKRKSGEIFPTEHSVSLLRNEAGERVGIVSLVRDISERKRAEQAFLQKEDELRQAQRLESLGLLAGGVAHDFNNVLSGILAAAELMELEEELCVPYAEEIKAYVERGAGLTRQLLGFARKGKYTPKPLALGELLADVLKLFGRTRKDVQTALEQSFEKDLVMGDKSQLEQVFMNLFINAGQAMPEGGKLSVRLNQKDYSEHWQGPHLEVTVTDTGSGMDAETQKRIFEPFFTTKSRDEGSGLGLAAVFGIMQNHEGVISVQSEPGVGTSFVLRLPLAEGELPTPSMTSLAAVTGGEGLILVIDDEESLLQGYREMLTRLGYEVITARSGEEGLALFREHHERVLLVMLDWIMPGTSGRETFERLRELSPSLDVVICSGFAAENEVAALMDSGCRAFLQKPFLLKELSKQLHEILPSATD